MISPSTNFLPEGIFDVEKVVGKRIEDDGFVVNYQVTWEGYPSL